MLNTAPAKQARNRPTRQANGQFSPGASGNPNGRPPSGHALADLIRTELDEPASTRGKKTKREALAKVVVDRALKGDFRFVKMLIEHTEPACDQQANGESAESVAAGDWISMLEFNATSQWVSAPLRERSQALLKAMREFEELDSELDECGDAPPPIDSLLIRGQEQSWNRAPFVNRGSSEGRDPMPPQ